jgi:hypothetical protein
MAWPALLNVLLSALLLYTLLLLPASGWSSPRSGATGVGQDGAADCGGVAARRQR